MKKILYIFCLLIFGFTLSQEKINFQTDAFQNLLAKAKKEKKLIFLDAFASWCGPCKMMDKNIFTKKNVMEFYNVNFINAQIDMEKGEGRDIAMKYRITSYPTLLFINSDGEVVQRSSGYQNEEEFIEFGKTANNPLNKGESLRKRFDKGEKTPEFLINIVKLNANSDYDFAKLASERYFAEKKNNEFSQEEINMLLYFMKKEEDPNYKIFVAKKSEIIKILPENIYTQFNAQIKLSKVLEKAIDISNQKINEQYFLEEATKLIGNEEAKNALNRLKLNFYEKNNFSEYEKAALEYYKDGDNLNANELNKISKLFLDNSSSKISLNKAIIWAQKSVMMSENYQNTLVLASLYQKIGDQDNAKSWAKMAVDLAKKNQEDDSEAQKLIPSQK